jgi:hypothetical protein
MVAKVTIPVHESRSIITTVVHESRSIITVVHESRSIITTAVHGSHSTTTATSVLHDSHCIISIKVPFASAERTLRAPAVQGNIPIYPMPSDYE